MNKELIENNKRLIEAYFEEVWNQGKVDRLADLITGTYINHSPSYPNPSPGPEGLKPIVLAMRKGFPDLHYQIEDLILTENHVVARVTMTGTQTGELFGMPATGRKVAVSQINIEYMRDGKIAEHWRVTEELKMMQQLGAV